MFYNIRRHLRKVGVTGHNDIEHFLKIFEITGRTNEISGLAASLTQNEFDNCINISNIFGLTDIPSANEVKFELFGVISRKDKIVSKVKHYSCAKYAHVKQNYIQLKKIYNFIISSLYFHKSNLDTV